jgi:predicted TIM-barrel fold metal-dependent hydrolase
MTETLVRPVTRTRTTTATIDCDIHNALVSDKDLLPYLPARWRQHLETFGLRNYRYAGGSYPRLFPNAARADAWPPSGLPPGADLAFLREQLLDAWQIEVGILNPLMDGPTHPNRDYGAAVASALNEWQIRDWVEPEPRLRASMIVNYEDGELAAAEIDRLGDDPRFVQVLLIARTHDPLGKRTYWKMYEAAERHGLPIGIHFGGFSGNPITGAGWPSFYIEDHCGMPQTFQAQVISLVCEGVFEHFPHLKIVVIEGVFAWLPSLMWRLDMSWKRLKEEAPHLRRLPSEYIRDHFWLTTQPMEEPPVRGHFRRLLDQLAMNDKLMFATDYPHWDFDSPEQAFPEKLPPDLEAKFMAGNARSLYRL